MVVAPGTARLVVWGRTGARPALEGGAGTDHPRRLNRHPLPGTTTGNGALRFSESMANLGDWVRLG